MSKQTAQNCDASKGLPRSARLRGKTFRIKHRATMTDCGLCDDTPDVRRIWVRLNQSPSDFLETLVHEGLHACLPDITEEAITETAEGVAKMLWRYGYRRKL